MGRGRSLREKEALRDPTDSRTAPAPALPPGLDIMGVMEGRTQERIEKKREDLALYKRMTELRREEANVDREIADAFEELAGADSPPETEEQKGLREAREGTVKKLIKEFPAPIAASLAGILGAGLAQVGIQTDAVQVSAQIEALLTAGLPLLGLGTGVVIRRANPDTGR